MRFLSVALLALAALTLCGCPPSMSPRYAAQAGQ